MPHLSWNEVRDRPESAEKQTFWNDFFLVFGLRRASLASFEENVRNIKGNKGAIDLLWKGRLLVEHKSYGEDSAKGTAGARKARCVACPTRCKRCHKWGHGFREKGTHAAALIRRDFRRAVEKCGRLVESRE